MAATPLKWQCHVCLAGPYLRETTTRCINVLANGSMCGHPMCDECKKDDAIPTPLGPPLQGIAPVSSMAMPRIMHSMRSTRGHGQHILKHPLTPNVGSRDGGRSFGPHVHSSFRLSTRPSMRGWWKCHKCRYTNNPSLNPVRCLECQHPKCQYCAPA